MHNRGYARYVVGNIVKTLADTPTAGSVLPGGAQSALIQNRDAANDLAFRDDGTDPTGAESMILKAGQSMTYDADLSKFRMIRAGGADVTSVVISYYSET